MRLAFAGTPEFAAKALEALYRRGHEVPLVFTQPDRPVGRGLKLVPSPVKKTALSGGSRLYQPETLKSGDALEAVLASRPDVLVVAAYGRIVPASLLSAARFGAVNIHASLLPRWRGAAPIQRALLAGDAQTGISIMQMDAGLDTGPVYAQRAIDIRADDDAGTLHDRLAALGAEMIVEALEQLPHGLEPVAQPREGVTYAAKITKSDVVLDWRRSAAELERAIRAFRPVPGASTRLDGASLKIWRASVLEESGEPGRLVRTQADALVIGCGEGALAVTELQRAGGRRMRVGEFLQGHPLQPGVRFE